MWEDFALLLKFKSVDDFNAIYRSAVQLKEVYIAEL